MFKKFSDKSIIEGIRNQDDKILNWLYDHYYQTVKNHVVKNNGTIEDVSDVFQDSIIILYDQVCKNDINLTSDLKGYFFGIVRNIWSVQLRKKKETIELFENIPDEPEYDDMNELLFEKIVSRAFLKLKPDHQLLLNLVAEGYSYRDIAEKMDLKTETYARRKKYLCKEALMELIREDPEYPDYQGYLRLTRKQE